MKNWSMRAHAWCVRRFEMGHEVEVWWRHIKDPNPRPDRKQLRVAIDRHIPQSVLAACIGKPINGVTDHPLVHEHFGSEDTIKEAMMTDFAPYGSGQLTVFEIRRKRSKQATTLLPERLRVPLAARKTG